MPSEHDDSNTSWQNHNTQNWDEPFDYPDTSSPEDEQNFQDEAYTDQDPWSDSADSSSTTLDVVAHVSRKFSPLLVPLVFAALTFLFTLPVELKSQAFLPLPVLAVLLLAIAVLQGTLLYFAGSNEGAWSLSIIAGFALFLLLGCFTIFGQFATIVLLVALLLIGLLLTGRCIRIVPEGYVDIVYSFGKYTRTLLSGFNLLAPWETIHSQLNVRETFWTSPLQRVRISRESDVQYLATIAYQLMPEDAHIAALNIQDWEDALHQLFIPTVQSVINDLSPQDFIAWSQTSRSRKSNDVSSVNPNMETRWDKIDKLLTQRVQDKVASWGVQVNEVYIQDITLLPHIGPDVNTDANAKTHMADASMPRGAQAAASQSMPAKVMSNRIEGGTPGQAPHSQYAAPHPPVQQPAAPAPSLSQQPAVSTTPPHKDDVLTEAYEAVRKGRITDPETIRSIAQRFEAIAADPEARQNVDFDAARAAGVLRQRAQMYEDTMNQPPDYNDDTQSDWQPPLHRPANNNLMTGG